MEQLTWSLILKRLGFNEEKEQSSWNVGDKQSSILHSCKVVESIKLIEEAKKQLGK